MQSGNTLFQGRNVTFEQIIHEKRLGGTVAVLNYLSYRRDNCMGRLASVEGQDHLSERLGRCVHVFSRAEQILRHVTQKQTSK